MSYFSIRALAGDKAAAAAGAVHEFKDCITQSLKSGNRRAAADALKAIGELKGSSARRAAVSVALSATIEGLKAFHDGGSAALGAAHAAAVALILGEGRDYHLSGLRAAVLETLNSGLVSLESHRNVDVKTSAPIAAVAADTIVGLIASTVDACKVAKAPKAEKAEKVDSADSADSAALVKAAESARDSALARADLLENERNEARAELAAARAELAALRAELAALRAPKAPKASKGPKAPKIAEPAALLAA